MLREVTQIFKALSDTNRVRIIEMLRDRPLCVCEITTLLGLAPSTVSKHLSVLRDTGLISDEKEGKWVNYRLTNSADNEYIQHLLFLMQNWLRDSEVIREDKTNAGSIDRNSLCGI